MRGVGGGQSSCTECTRIRRALARREGAASVGHRVNHQITAAARTSLRQCDPRTGSRDSVEIDPVSARAASRWADAMALRRESVAPAAGCRARRRSQPNWASSSLVAGAFEDRHRFTRRRMNPRSELDLEVLPGQDDVVEDAGRRRGDLRLLIGLLRLYLHDDVAGVDVGAVGMFQEQSCLLRCTCQNLALRFGTPRLLRRGGLVDRRDDFVGVWGCSPPRARRRNGTGVSGAVDGLDRRVEVVERLVGDRAAMSRAIEATGVSSSTTTSAVVSATDSRIVSSSSGASVSTSTTFRRRRLRRRDVLGGLEAHVRHPADAAQRHVRPRPHDLRLADRERVTSRARAPCGRRPRNLCSITTTGPSSRIAAMIRPLAL